MTEVAPLTRMVPMTYLGAVQAIAALESRIAEYRGYVERGHDVGFVVADAHLAVTAIREAFRIPEWREAHEAAEAARDNGRPQDVPTALDSYWNRGA